jgi:hypothetical protein
MKKIVEVFLLAFLLAGCKDAWHPEGPADNTTYYTVTYDAGGAGGTPPKAHTAVFGTIVYVAGQGNLYNPGKIFGGWILGNTGVTYAAGASLTLTSNIYMGARWDIMNFTEATLDPMKSDIAALAAADDGWSSAYPIVVKITIADASLLSGTNSGAADTLHKLFDAIPSGTYVSYDLSGCTFTGIGDVTAAIANARTNTAYLASITLPDTLTGIGNYAFYNCTGLTSVTIPESVTSIGDYAFDGCTGLTSVYVQRGTMPLTALGSDVFLGTNAFLVIYVPASVLSAYMFMPDWSTYTSRIQAAP